MKQQNSDVAITATMTSVQIAEVAGKQHKDVLRAIRLMEPAWEKVRGRKFALSQYEQSLPTGGVKKVPCYTLTKTECLYIATKFNDEARARLILRWEELETNLYDEIKNRMKEARMESEKYLSVALMEISEAERLEQVNKAICDGMKDTRTTTKKLSFIIGQLSSLYSMQMRISNRIDYLSLLDQRSEVDFSGVSVGDDLLEVLRDIIVDYPLCASESAVADMDSVGRNVRVLNSLYAVIRNHFGRAKKPAGLNNSLVCK